MKEWEKEKWDIGTMCVEGTKKRRYIKRKEESIRKIIRESKKGVNGSERVGKW